MTHRIEHQDLVTEIFKDRTWSRSMQGVFESRAHLHEVKTQTARDISATIVTLLDPLRAQLHSHQQALTNLNGAISLLQVMTDATADVEGELAAMELIAEAAQAVTMTDSERATKNQSYADHAKTIFEAAATTHYDNIQLLDGTAGDGSNNLNFNLGAQGDSADTITIALPNFTEQGLFGGPTSVATLVSANKAYADITAGRTVANTTIAQVDAALRALMSQDQLVQTVLSYLQNQEQSYSHDAIGASTAEKARIELLSDTTTGILAQANQQPIKVMDLLEQEIPVKMVPFSVQDHIVLETRTPPFINLLDRG